MDKIPPKIRERLMEGNKHFRRRAEEIAEQKKKGRTLTTEERVRAWKRK